MYDYCHFLRGNNVGSGVLAALIQERLNYISITTHQKNSIISRFSVIFLIKMHAIVVALMLPSAYIKLLLLEVRVAEISIPY